MKKSELITKIVNIVCAVLMLALIVCQFLPFWVVDGESTSIQSFCWFSTKDKQMEVQNYLQDTLGKDAYFVRTKNIVAFEKNPKPGINEAIVPALGVLAFGALGVYFCLRNFKKPINGIWALLCGLSCVVGYMILPAYQLGQNWMIHVALGGVITALSLVLLVQWVISVYHWFKG